jgi:protein phosphatase PTC7
VEKYRVKILTGNRRGAGTDAQIFATIVGTRADSGERKLEPKLATSQPFEPKMTSGTSEPFERNTWTEFELSVPGGLGEVKQVRIGHRDESEGWYLSRILIEPISTIAGEGEPKEPAIATTFHVHKWLGQSESGGLSGPSYITCEVTETALVASTMANPPPMGRTLRLRSGCMALPHPEKVNKGIRAVVKRSKGHAGEDAYIMTGQEPGTGPPYVLGIADGVRQWSEKGIDAGEWSRTLLQEAWDDIHRSWKDTKSISLQAVMETAFTNTLAKKVLGSSTLCLVTLRPNGELSSVNIGDSGYLLFRPQTNTMLYRSGQQEKAFGCPFQLGHHKKSDAPGDAVPCHFSVQAGDVVVLGSDGLFDNLSDKVISPSCPSAPRCPASPRSHSAPLFLSHDVITPCITAQEITDVMCAHLDSTWAGVKGKRRGQLEASALEGEGLDPRVLACNPAALARDLVKEAFAASVDKRRCTPFSWSASEEFNLVYSGGKMDDITVLVGLVELEPL